MFGTFSGHLYFRGGQSFELKVSGLGSLKLKLGVRL